MQVLLFDLGGNFVDDITKFVGQSLRFSTRVPGLYYQLDLTITADFPLLMFGYDNYLGHRIVVMDSGQIVWDGLIWSLGISIGDSSLGPRDLNFVWNYVVVEYSDILNDGRYALTSYISDADSQARYGIKEQVLPYGSMTSVAAARARDAYSLSHKQPFVGGTFSFPPSSEETSLRIGALGWWATTRYRKFQSIVTSLQNVIDVIKNIVNRTVVPNLPASTYYLQMFSTDTSLIEGTNLQIARATFHYDAIGSYLEHIVSLGDNSNNIWYIGAEHGNYNGRFPLGAPRVKVWQRPTSPEFTLDMSTGKVWRGGADVSPYMIRAGNFVKVVNFAPSGMPIYQSRSFVVAQTDYDASRGVIGLTPEGTDQQVEIILARMSG